MSRKHRDPLYSGSLAKWYSDLYYTSDRTNAETNFLKTIINERAPGQRVHELAGGSGRLAIPLAKSGFDVSISDISEDMLAIAAAHAKEAGVALKLMSHDLRREFSSFVLLDAIVLGCSAIVHILNSRELIRVITSCKSSLNAGGIIIIDVENYWRRIIDGANGETLTRRSDGSRELIVRSSASLKPNESIARCVQIIECNINGRPTHQSVVREFDFRIFTKNEIEILLSACGFERLEFFSNYDGDPVADHSNERIICVGVRP